MIKKQSSDYDDEDMTFLSKKRTRETYFEKISTKSKSLQNSTRIVLDSFDKFCSLEYSHDSEQVIRELLGLKIEEREESACDVYQSWINWSHKKGTSAKTLKVYFSLLKSYIHYRGIKISDKDINREYELLRDAAIEDKESNFEKKNR